MKTSGYNDLSPSVISSHVLSTVKDRFALLRIVTIVSLYNALSSFLKGCTVSAPPEVYPAIVPSSFNINEIPFILESNLLILSF